MGYLRVLGWATALLAPVAASAQAGGQGVQSVPAVSSGGSVEYWASYWSSDWSSYQDSSNRSVSDTSQRVGNVQADSTFQAGAVVSSANLASNVSNVSVRVGADGGSGSVQTGLTLGTGAFQGFAGVQALNMNTGAAASQNASVNVNTPGR